MRSKDTIIILYQSAQMRQKHAKPPHSTRTRYALTTRDGGEAIGVLINLTQLETFVAKERYKTLNGHLYIDGEEIHLSTLCADSLAGTIVSNSQPFILKK